MPLNLLPEMQYKKYLLTGLLVWLPLAVTIWILLWLVGLLDAIFLGVLSGLQAFVPANTGLVQIGRAHV